MQAKKPTPLCIALKLDETVWQPLDEKIIEEWILSGMVGKLVKRKGNPIRIEPCPPEQDGQWGIYHLT